MQDAKDLKEYRRQMHESLDNEFLRKTLDTFAVAYRAGRAKAFAPFDVAELVADVARSKDEARSRIGELYLEFKRKAEEAGVKVHFAADAAEANEVIVAIARENGVKMVIKSKSMTAEETLLNHALEDGDLEVVETDLGEWIIQLRHEGPSHMVMPAIHLSRYQVGELFTRVTGKEQQSDIEKLVKVARRELREKFVRADMGITGANFAVAETGAIGLVTNEGNARLVTTLPRVHVALMGIDKLVARTTDALKILKVLPRNATGQNITSYVSWITGANECGPAQGGKKITHFVFLDNGRLEMAADPLFSQVFRCVRCGACANVCPVYRLVGGHKMGHIYIGAIGLILTHFFHGAQKSKNLVQNCINCEACKEVCAGGIDLPRLIQGVRARILDETKHPLPNLLLGKVLANRKLFHTLLRTANRAERPVADHEGFIRHLPMIFFKEHDYKAVPAVARSPFRDRWPGISKGPGTSGLKVGLFTGCVQDFVYPEQMEAAARIFAARGVAMSFPMSQSCCGLPVQMMGETQAARNVAVQNIRAFEKDNLDHIVTLCASCASHLKINYPVILDGESKMGEKARAFAAKVIDFSSFANDVLGLEAGEFSGEAVRATFHAPCHLCRGLGVHEAPRSLIRAAGFDFREADESEVCCGFGGTFSIKFPELSARILNKKLEKVEETGASILLTDCPGCILQLRGGLRKRGSPIRVMHTAEALAARMRKV